MTESVNALGGRWRLYGLALGEGARRMGRSLRGSVARLTSLGGRAPERLLVAPQDLRTTDPTVAADIYAGYFAFDGRILESKGRSVFELEPPSPAWAATLNGFVWLRHLRAADTALARANARALVDDFLSHGGGRVGVGAEPAVVARRLMSFLSQSPLILDGADHNFYRRFMRTLGRSTTQLLQAMAGPLTGEDRLPVAIALAYAGLCLAGPARLYNRANALLAEEIKAQILPDGAHISRNPRTLIDLLTDLLPLRQTYAARGLAPPVELVNGIDRMMPMLRLFRHGDGALARFNGMGSTGPDLLATLLAYDDARAQPIEHAPYAGYERLQSGATLMIADVGAPPPRAFSRDAHAGCLSFELSSGRSHIVVNCGAPGFGDSSTAMAARSTAAHSTATVADASSCRFAGRTIRNALGVRLGAWLGAGVLSGPREVKAERGTDQRGLTLAASHDGYKADYGMIHERLWHLDKQGVRLDGLDRFHEASPNAAPLPVTLRFHLHPDVKASRSQDGRTAMLLLPSGETWAFDANGLPLSLEESVFFAAANGLRRTEQIVVGIEVAKRASVHWRFVRLEQKAAS
jgi:uncharacterized heparinase superfamily protein